MFLIDNVERLSGRIYIHDHLGKVSKTRGEEERPDPAPDRGVRGVGLLHVVDDQLEEGVAGTEDKKVTSH